MFKDKKRNIDIIISIALFIFVSAFWVFTYNHAINVTPRYHKQLEPVRNLGWGEIWTWTNYGHYSRYSPIGMLAIGLLDRDYLAPALGIDPMSNAFENAGRLIPLYYLLFSCISILTFYLCRSLSLHTLPSLIAALYLGVNDGFSYFFYYVDTLAVCLLLIFGICVIYFWIKYLNKQKPLFLVLYYIFFLLSIGSWDQWINLLLCIILFSIFLLFRKKANKKRIIIHGLIIPLILFLVYLLLRLPAILNETGRTAEAQYVFSYPSKRLMIEDMVSNISHHIAGSIDALFFPWPMISQAVINKIDINQYNQYNLFSPYADMHYRAFTEWYVGLLFGVFMCGLGWIIYYFKEKTETHEIILLSILLIFIGFLAHLPVMFRIYFDLPGYVGLLNYKDSLTVLGVSILVGFLVNHFLKIKNSKLLIILAIILNFWIVNNNYQKIFINFIFKRGIYPW